jgi:uncharacterized membrane-anchored protein
MKMDKKQFILVVSIPAIVILVFLGIKLFTYSFGQEILLETAPVDPRDLFRGDYVALSYKISRIDLSSLPHDTNFSSGQAIYASLSKKEKFWTIDSVSHSKPSLEMNQVCMKGKVINSFENQLFIEWGIESYFVPEGKGVLIESQRDVKNTSVIVSVDSTCCPMLKELLINDKPIEFEYESNNFV